MTKDQFWLRIAAGGLVVLAMLLSSHSTIGMITTNAANGYYENCAQARAAGVTPIMAGESGYRPELDADRDGVACEPWTGAP